MGKLKVIKTGPLATIQDYGRFGYRRYGIPQSGAMDKEWMIAANQLIGNPDNHPAVEFAMMGLKLEVKENATISVVGATFKVNGEKQNQKAMMLNKGDLLEVSSPDHVYGYIGMEGQIQAKEDFGSFSTYLVAGFGGMEGRALRVGDELISDKSEVQIREIHTLERDDQDIVVIRMMKGPEWGVLKELPCEKPFKVDVSSDRMGIRLTDASLDCDYKEIASSAVVPGTIQLPSNGQPIVLMNDCQTTGGYPRIGKVIEEDMGKLVQVRRGRKIMIIERTSKNRTKLGKNKDSSGVNRMQVSNQETIQIKP